MRYLIGMCLAAWVVSAQTPLAFDAVSVKPSQTTLGGEAADAAARWVEKPGRIEYTTVSMFDLIARAYGMEGSRVVPPSWAYTSRWDIVATLPPNAGKQDVPAMLQALLKERFGLAVHRELKELPGFALVISRKGSKLRPSELPGGLTAANLDNGETRAEGSVTMARLAAFLKREMNTGAIVDMTGLEGAYAVDLTWSKRATRPNATRKAGGSGAGNAEPLPQAPGMSLSDAVEQYLGLTLEARSMKIDAVIVDHLEKEATAN